VVNPESVAGVSHELIARDTESARHVSQGLRLSYDLIVTMPLPDHIFIPQPSSQNPSPKPILPTRPMWIPESPIVLGNGLTLGRHHEPLR
jgi:hypothetical protein